MPHTADCLCGRSQHFTFPRRELLQKIASVTLLFFVSRNQSVIKLPEKYPAPDFFIGDKVVAYWPDERGVDEPEYGEVFGVCWHPTKQQWEYLIEWTVECDAGARPFFDESLVGTDILRRLYHV